MDQGADMRIRSLEQGNDPNEGRSTSCKSNPLPTADGARAGSGDRPSIKALHASVMFRSGVAIARYSDDFPPSTPSHYCQVLAYLQRSPSQGCLGISVDGSR